MTIGSCRSSGLVTGMSGAGKSAVLAELGSRGHRVVDTDDPGWIVEVRTSHGVEPVCDLGRIAALLDGHHAAALFVAGCVMNRRALYERFDAVVLLNAPLEIILGRVSDRANRSGPVRAIARRSRAIWSRSSRCCAPPRITRSSPPRQPPRSPPRSNRWPVSPADAPGNAVVEPDKAARGAGRTDRDGPP